MRSALKIAVILLSGLAVVSAVACSSMQKLPGAVAGAGREFWQTMRPPEPVTPSPSPVTPQPVVIAPVPTPDPSARVDGSAGKASDTQPPDVSSGTTSSAGPVGLALKPSGRGKIETAEGGAYHAYCDGFPGAARQQETDLWCWAAGIQMVYKYRSEDITQTVIVQRITGGGSEGNTESAPVKAAIEWEVMLALCPDQSKTLHDRPGSMMADSLVKMMQNNKGGKTKVQIDYMKLAQGATSMFTFSPSDMVEAVAHGSPVLVSLKFPSNPSKAHMYVVYGATFTAKTDVMAGVFHNVMHGSQGGQKQGGQKQGGQKQGAQPQQQGPTETYTVSQIEVVNPWTGKVETLQADDFSTRVAYMMTEASARETLGSITSSLTVKN